MTICKLKVLTIIAAAVVFLSGIRGIPVHAAENHLTERNGVYYGPSGKETYYNLNMSRIVSRLKESGYSGDYWVREDGVKMFGDYILCAADFGRHPYGSLMETSLGTAIAADTGTFASNGSGVQCDIAVSW